MLPRHAILSVVAVFAPVAATAAFAEPVVTTARIERLKGGIRATVRGTMAEADWGAATAVDVGVADETAALAAPRLRYRERSRKWTFTDARGAVVRGFTFDVRRGKFTVRCRTSDPADYADPLAFSLAPEGSFRFEIPVTTDRRVTMFRGALAPIPDDPDDPDDPPDPPGPRRVVAYFTAWGIYARNYHVKDVDTSGAAARITHLNYAFANIGTDLRAELHDAYADIDRYYDAASSVDGVADTWDAGTLRGNFRQLEELKAKHPGLRVLISLGGWTLSGRFSDAALTAESRAAFVESCIDRFVRGNFAPGVTRPGIFDGIDVDWEWPAAPGATNNYRPEDTANYTALLARFRSELDAQGTRDGRTYLLTIAAPAGETNIAKFDVAGIAPLVDGVNLMSYDFRGAWDMRTGHQAPLHAPSGDPSPALNHRIDRSVSLWKTGGLPAAKLTMGVPFYGRGWTGVPAGPSGDGLWQTASGAATGTYEAGIEDWHTLVNLPASYMRRFDAASGASWLFDSASGVFWSWDDAQSIAAKASWANANGLGGMMVWELSGDDRSATLLRGLADSLAAPAKR